jgi:hypothetical protein
VRFKGRERSLQEHSYFAMQQTGSMRNSKPYWSSRLTRSGLPGTRAFNNFSDVGSPGTGTLTVDGKEVATRRMEKTLLMILQWDGSFDVGSDTLTGVNDADYKPPFALTAKLNKLTVKVGPADIRRLETTMREKAKAD